MDGRARLYLPPLRIANIEVQIAKLDSEAWPGLLDPERDRLILINEKEELLKELQYSGPRQRLEPHHAQKMESERRRLERDLQAARDNQSKALTERWVQLQDRLHPSFRSSNQGTEALCLQSHRRVRWSRLLMVNSAYATFLSAGLHRVHEQAEPLSAPPPRPPPPPSRVLLTGLSLFTQTVPLCLPET